MKRGQRLECAGIGAAGGFIPTETMARCRAQGIRFDADLDEGRDEQVAGSRVTRDAMGDEDPVNALLDLARGEQGIRLHEGEAGELAHFGEVREGHEGPILDREAPVARRGRIGGFVQKPETGVVIGEMRRFCGVKRLQASGHGVEVLCLVGGELRQLRRGLPVEQGGIDGFAVRGVNRSGEKEGDEGSSQGADFHVSGGSSLSE